MKTKAKTIKSKPLHRSYALDRAGVDDENRTAELAFSSEEPYERWFGIEILDHNPKSVRMDRLKSGAPLLVNHDTNDHVGVVESARIDKDGKGRATVRFGKGARASEIFQDVKDGIRSLVSVGYRIHEMVTESVKDGVETMRVVDWEPLELTLASVPADPTVGVGRASDTEENTITITRKVETMDNEKTKTETGNTSPPAPQPQATVTSGQEVNQADVLTNIRKDEGKRVDTIREAAKRVGKYSPDVATLADTAIRNGMSVLEFQDKLTGVLEKAAGNPLEQAPPSEGMNQRDLKNYSFTRAIMSCLPTSHGGSGGLSGFEKEMSDEVAKRTGKSPKGFYVPEDVMQKRVLEVGTFTGAGALVGTTDGGQPLIDLLRNNMIASQLGVTMLSGLSGDVDIPRQTGGGTASWLAEGATLSRADQTVGQLSLRPHRLSAATAFSKQLLAQSSPDVEGFVRNDLMTVIALAKDLAITSGTGVSGQPQGIINTSGLSTAATHTAAGTFTWGQALDYESQVESNNALGNSMAYLMYAPAKKTAKETFIDSGSGLRVWGPDNRINGYPAYSTNQLSAGAGGCMFGDWSKVIVGDWDGMDVLVDPFSLSLNGQISIVIQTLCDVGLRQPTAFSISAA